MQGQRFKEKDHVKLKALKDCVNRHGKKGYWSGNEGYHCASGKIRNYKYYVEEAGCWMMDVTIKMADGYTFTANNILEREVQQWDSSIPSEDYEIY